MSKLIVLFNCLLTGFVKLHQIGHELWQKKTLMTYMTDSGSCSKMTSSRNCPIADPAVPSNYPRDNCGTNKAAPSGE